MWVSNSVLLDYMADHIEADMLVIGLLVCMVPHIVDILFGHIVAYFAVHLVDRVEMASLDSVVKLQIDMAVGLKRMGNNLVIVHMKLETKFQMHIVD